jgi:hypothetical protein
MTVNHGKLLDKTVIYTHVVRCFIGVMPYTWSRVVSGTGYTTVPRGAALWRMRGRVTVGS